MSEHYFHDKDTDGNWTVSCKATGGSFSFAIDDFNQYLERIQ